MGLGFLFDIFLFLLFMIRYLQVLHQLAEKMVIEGTLKLNHFVYKVFVSSGVGCSLEPSDLSTFSVKQFL